jgi:hypothetical protein
MAANRCFGSSNKSNSNSSDYTISNKQKTIFTGIVNQIPTNFNKTNGQKYNKNFGLDSNCNLTSSKSYDLLLDVTKGRRIANPLLPTSNGDFIGTSSHEAWSGNLYSINYNNNGINNVVDTSYNAGNDNTTIIFPMTDSELYPGIIVDPSYQIFYDGCSSRNNNRNVWRSNLVDMSLLNIDFANNNYYKQNILNSQKLYGMNFPEKVSFNISSTCPTKEVETGTCPTKEVDTGTIIENSDGTLSGKIFSSNEALERLRGCTKINGDLLLRGFTGEIDFSVFDCLQEIIGFFGIAFNAKLTKVSGFGNLQTVKGDFFIAFNAKLIEVSGFEKLKGVGGNFVFNENAELKTLSGFEKLVSVRRDFGIENNAELTRISGFGNLKTVGEIFGINFNAELTTISGFENLEKVDGSFKMDTNAKLTTLSGFGNLEKVGGYFIISNNAKLTTLSGFGNLERVGSEFNISFNALLTTLSGFGNLETVGYFFQIFDNSSGVPATNNIVLTISGFGSFRTTPNPKGITGNLILQGLSETQKISISQAIINNMTNINFTLGDTITGVTVSDVVIT